MTFRPHPAPHASGQTTDSRWQTWPPCPLPNDQHLLNFSSEIFDGDSSYHGIATQSFSQATGNFPALEGPSLATSDNQSIVWPGGVTEVDASFHEALWHGSGPLEDASLYQNTGFEYHTTANGYDQR